jgi:glycosyltransferase involved in cell wall biosynthesis
LKLCACIPAYNEERHIAPLIVRLRRYVNQIIVCDDGSSDLTYEVAEQIGVLVIRHQSNLGKGAALRSLFKAALDSGADVIVTIDADGQHRPEEIPTLIQPILAGDADVVNGSRMSYGRMPGHRKFGNLMLNGLTRIVSSRAQVPSARRQFVRDSQTGFRAYTRQALAGLEVFTNGMGIDSELIANAIRHGLRIKEIDVSVIYHGDTSTHNPVRHVGDVVLSLIWNVVSLSPLRYLSIPGTCFMGFGSAMLAIVVKYYVSQQYFSLPFAIIGFVSILFGALLFITGLILFSISKVLDRLEMRTVATKLSPYLSAPNHDKLEQSVVVANPPIQASSKAE